MAGDTTGSIDVLDQADPVDRVLVVEDDTFNRRALARAIENEGLAVELAANGAEALELLARRPDPTAGSLVARVDLVLLDLVMPLVDGFAVLEAMQREPDLARIPVLVISGVEDTASIARAIEMGAIDVLPKPFDPILVKVRLRTALQQSRLRRLEQRYLRQELAFRQQEKLATLGRLSAGLAHELNNPAGAVQRTAQRLATRLDDVQSTLADLVARPDAEQLIGIGATIADVRSPSASGMSSVDRLDAEDAVEAALRALGVDNPSRLAPRLVAAGIGPDALGVALAGVAPDAQTLAVRWLLTRVEIRDAVGHITTGIGRISEIIGALRSYSYMDRAPQQDVDVRVGLEDALTMLAHKLADGITVVRDHQADLPTIDAHGSQLNQVWTNLLDNAIDALAGRGTITVRTRGAPGDGVVVEIIDDGPGIPAELQPRVLEPFVTTKPPGQGTGLGLNISHQIVTDVHGGRLTVSSRPGHTVFTVRLPSTANPTAEESHVD